MLSETGTWTLSCYGKNTVTSLVPNTSLVPKHGIQCMPGLAIFSVTLQTEILSIATF